MNIQQLSNAVEEHKRERARRVFDAIRVRTHNTLRMAGVSHSMDEYTAILAGTNYRVVVLKASDELPEDSVYENVVFYSNKKLTWVVTKTIGARGPEEYGARVIDNRFFDKLQLRESLLEAIRSVEDFRKRIRNI